MKKQHLLRKYILTGLFSFFIILSVFAFAPNVKAQIDDPTCGGNGQEPCKKPGLEGGVSNMPNNQVCDNEELEPKLYKAKGSHGYIWRCVGIGQSWNTPFQICSQIIDSASRDLCIDCAGESEDNDKNPTGVWTAIGCIPTSKEGIIQSLLTVGISIGGGVVLMILLAASFILSTSQGDPKRTEEAKNWITSAIGGLLFMLFSIVLLRTIGINILQIPGF